MMSLLALSRSRRSTSQSIGPNLAVSTGGKKILFPSLGRREEHGATSGSKSRAQSDSRVQSDHSKGGTNACNSSQVANLASVLPQVLLSGPNVAKQSTMDADDLSDAISQLSTTYESGSSIWSSECTPSPTTSDDSLRTFHLPLAPPSGFAQEQLDEMCVVDLKERPQLRGFGKIVSAPTGGLTQGQLDALSGRSPSRQSERKHCRSRSVPVAPSRRSTC